MREAIRMALAITALASMVVANIAIFTDLGPPFAWVVLGTALLCMAS